MGDCSRRMCPKGNDVLDTRIDTSDTQLYQVQEITLYAGGTFGDGMGAKRNLLTAKQSTDILGKKFALTFTTTLNETYTTIPINLKTSDSNAARATAIQNALLGLPNKVIDGVTASVAEGSLTDGPYYVRILLTFTGDAVQGRQNLIEVEHFACTNKYIKFMRLSYVQELVAAAFNN